MQVQFKLTRDCGFSNASEFRGDDGRSFQVPARHRWNAESCDDHESVHLSVNTPQPLTVSVGDCVSVRLRRFKASAFGADVVGEFVGLVKPSK